MVLSTPLVYLGHFPRSKNLITTHLPHAGLSRMDDLKLLSNQLNKSFTQRTMSVRNTSPDGHTSPVQRLFAHALLTDLPQPASSLEFLIPPLDTLVTDHFHRKLQQKRRLTNMQAHLSLIFFLESTYIQSHHLPRRLRPVSKEKFLVLLVLVLTSLILVAEISSENLSKSSFLLLSTQVASCLMTELHQLFLTNLTKPT